MAVGTGYSKVATNGLVFAYDVGDTRNSYIGEPTTNLANFDIASAIFSTDTPGNLTQTQNSLEATYQGRPSKKMSVGAGYWNAYIYNYNTSISSINFTVSYKVKMADGSHPNTIIGGGYIYGSAGSFFPSPAFTYLQDNWYQVSITYSGTSMILNSLTGMNGNGGPKIFYIVDYQAEALSHYTPFSGVSGGTRTTTQGLLDISGKGSTITLNNSYDANAQFYFDGTDDRIQVTDNIIIRPSTTLTMEAVFRMTTKNTYNTVMVKPTSGPPWGNPYVSYMLRVQNASLQIGMGLDGTYRAVDHLFNYLINTTYHVAFTYNNNGTIAYYLNGNAVSLSGTMPSASNITYGSPPLLIGAGYGSSPIGEVFTGSIPVAKLYNRSLTATEISQNYNHYKTRFNLP